MYIKCDYCITSIERPLSEHGNDSFQITIHCSTCIRFHGFTLQLISFITCDCESSAPFLAHLAKGHVSFCHHLASVVRRKLSHLNLLLRNHWAIYNQTLVEWSLDGPLPKLCPVIPTSNQYGRQAKNRKMGGMKL
jgi:hypothetical protein